jgi:sarcosine oxidase subunit gamma
MADAAGPLDGAMPLVTPRVLLQALPQHAKAGVRGRDGDAALVGALTGALGAPPPLTPNRATPAGARTVLWLGPGEWRVIGPPGDEAALLAALHTGVPRARAAVVDVSDFYVTLSLAGAGARDLLAQGCPLDLHPRAFATGQCAQTLLAKADILLHQLDATPRFDIQVRRSHAAYLWDWLIDAAAAG